MRENNDDNVLQVIELPSHFGSHMVLQRGVTTRILGRFRPDEQARIVLEHLPADGRPILPHDSQFGVVFEDQDRTDHEGYFDFRLPVLDASFDPYRLTITVADSRLTLSDLLVGDVWLAGGGANMALPVSRADLADQADALSNVEHVRLFTIPESGLFDDLQAYSYFPLDKTNGTWRKADSPDAVNEISAIGFGFARALLVALKVPIGLIDIAASGTYLHSWLSREVVEDDTFIKGRVREVKQYRDYSNWNRLKPDKQNAEGIRKAEIRIRRPKMAMDQPDEHQFDPKNQPSAMFNHKLAPFNGLSLRGILWYPSENELDAPDAFARAFRCLVGQFVSMFASPDGVPAVLYAQMPPGFYPNQDHKQIAVFNEMLAQVKRTLKVPAGYVTCYDLPLEYGGEDPGVYDVPYLPKAKAVIAVRLARIALGLVYGKDHAPSAPEPKAMEAIGNKLMLDFEHVGATGQGLRTSGDSRLLKGFAVCGEDRIFVPAMARILHGVQIMVWHDEITEPVSLTYGFANFNSDSNLVSSEGMPATAFRMDLEPSQYAKPMLWMDCDRLNAFVWPKKIVSIRRARREDWPSVRPLWTVTSGRGDLLLSAEHARWGDQSLLLSYKNADSRAVVFEPCLEYASLYPPLDLSMWKSISAHLFSVDHGKKQLALQVEDDNQVTYSYQPLTLDATYRFQELVFDLAEAQVNRARITKLRFTLTDPLGHGQMWLDRIRLFGIDTRNWKKDR